jgi:toxin-antitoxin system PIN domain toxin
VILVDANLLTYACVRSMEQQVAARQWLDARLNGAEIVGLPWPSFVAFMRVVCDRRIFRQASTLTQAWQQVSDWLAQENAWVPTPTERHAEVLDALLAAPGMRSDLVHDAHLAALAIEHGLELCSCDGDFARFRDLRWRNPIA